MSDQADNRAPYAQIAAHYAELITSGQLTPGSLLPSIKNLAQEWNVSTATAEKALRKLRTEGLVREFTVSERKFWTFPPHVLWLPAAGPGPPQRIKLGRR